MAADIRPGDKVQIYLGSGSWKGQGWFDGRVVRIEPYSQHRSFYWVELDEEARAILGAGLGLISVLNPKNIRLVGIDD